MVRVGCCKIMPKDILLSCLLVWFTPQLCKSAVKNYTLFSPTITVWTWDKSEREEEKSFFNRTLVSVWIASFENSELRMHCKQWPGNTEHGQALAEPNQHCWSNGRCTCLSLHLFLGELGTVKIKNKLKTRMASALSRYQLDFLRVCLDNSSKENRGWFRVELLLPVSFNCWRSSTR